jgi:hypothetical protein
MSQVRLVQEKLEILSLYDLDGPLDKAIERLQALQNLYKGKELKLNLRGEEYGDGKGHAVIYERPENEEEIKKREEEETRSRERRREQFESLKKEFGN